VLCEIEFGACQVVNPDVYRNGLQQLLRMIRIWPLTTTTARYYGEIADDLRRRGKVLSQVDIMLAATCRELDLVLVTTDRDFAALPWLKVEDWS
jgi:tRNA(fMet)-specific endonuclease VapC